jgi:hypothetical protein
MDNWKGAKEGGGQAEKAKSLYKGEGLGYGTCVNSTRY